MWTLREYKSNQIKSNQPNLSDIIKIGHRSRPPKNAPPKWNISDLLHETQCSILFVIWYIYNHHCLWDVKPQRISPYCYLNHLLAFCSVISQSLNSQSCRSIATCECNCDKFATELVGHALNFSSTFTLLSWNSTPLNSHLVRSYIRPGETKKTGKKAWNSTPLHNSLVNIFGVSFL